MKLEGSYDVPVPRKKVWDAFLNPATLKKAIPGCEKLEALGHDEFKATLKIGVAAVKGTFEGRVKITDKKSHESYRLMAEGSGGPGFVKPDTLITLTDIAAGTRVSNDADVQVGGLVGAAGQRSLGGVPQMVAAQFFATRTDLLNSAAPAPPSPTPTSD